MAKIRIYELAKELGIENNKDLVTEVRSLGIEIKGVMSTLTDEEAQTVRRRHAGASTGSSAGSTSPAPNRPQPSHGSGSQSGGSRPGSGSGSGSQGVRTSAPSTPAPSAAAATAAAEAKVIRRRGSGLRPAEREREKEREREAEEAAARVVVAPPVAATPMPMIRRERAPQEARVSAPEPSPRAELEAEPAIDPNARTEPKVGDRIELPKGTRRFRDGFAAKREQEQQGTEPARPEPQRDARPDTRRPDAGSGAGPGARRPEPRRAEEPPPRRVVATAAEEPQRARPSTRSTPFNSGSAQNQARSGAGSLGQRSIERDGPVVITKLPTKPVDESNDGDPDRRVVRNKEGVIVGAASSRSEPKILGFITLPTAPRRQQVIITEAAKGQTKGRATARKEREERVQQRQRKRPSRLRRDRGGTKQVSTVEMSDAKKRIRVDEAIQISDMAHQMGAKASRLIRSLWQMGMRNVTINSAIDVETAELIAAEYGYTIENVSFLEDEFLGDYDDEEVGELRAPVVTIMGHVDHGKTTLLDYIRSAKVAQGEAGGITQHIGAYRVETKQGPVVFIDTPGHEAFSAMRSRGAAVTDIVVLIVAADDGVMPTTREAIGYANDAGVVVVVAINKIDKHDANVGRVEQMLMKEGLVGINYGGETTIAHISAKTGQGVEELLETLAVQAEILELRAPNDGPAAGTVIESRIDKGRGVVATVLVQAGELVKGDIVVANEFSGKIRQIYTPAGESVKSALPSTPVEVLGLDGAPPAGERFYVVESEKDARQIVAHRREQRRRKESAISGPSLLERIKSRRIPILKIVVKADVQGSAEALKETLEDMSVDKVRVEVIHAGVGAINETDVKLAAAADHRLIIGFNVKCVGKAAPLADHEKIPIELFSIIYEATDKVRERMIDLLEPEYREVAQGEAEVRALFPIPRLGVVAGCRVVKGSVTRSSHIRVKRNGKILHEGRIHSLRVFKDDVREVKEGMECGIVVDGFAEVQPGDVLEAFELETLRPTL